MTTSRIDWSQVWYPGPPRAYSADEMARAGGDGPSATLVVSMAVNVAAIFFVVLQLAPAGLAARLTGALVALVVLGWAAARWLWWRPWRRPLLRASLAVAAAMLVLVILIRWQLPEPADRYPIALTMAIGSTCLVALLWFLVLWRSQQIDARLRELAERDRAVEMARRLAAAQLEPHFLFNTLASVQHWVQTNDERAAPLLTALTDYLRATLPLFSGPLLAAGDEVVAVERYLQVMQARLGKARLNWRIEVDDGLRAALLPPGMLLTLVENAIVHGVEPKLADGQLRLRAWRDGGDALFEVVDNGRGCGDASSEGIGLGNVRQALALVAGAAGRLTLAQRPEGGCGATLRLPYRTEATGP